MAVKSSFVYGACGLLVLGSLFASEAVVLPKASDGKVRVTYWEKWTGIEFEAIKKVVDEYNRSQDKIFVELLSVSSIERKTLLATAGGVPPDLAGLYSANVAQYVQDNAVLPLDDYCAKAGIKESDYIKVYWDMGVMDGHIYALPTTPATNALHYNRALFAKAGIDPDRPPRTIEELDAYTDLLTQWDVNGEVEVSGFLHSEPGWWNWAWMCFFGGELWNGEDKITCDSPENVRGMAWVQSYAKKYGATKLQNFKSGLGKFGSPQDSFMSHKVSMVLQGVWMSNFINTFNPQLQWSAAPFPHPADRPDLANSTIAEADILVIPRGAKHPDEAFEFIRFVQSQKGMEMLCLGQKKNSPLLVASEEFYSKHPNPYIRLFTELAKSPNVITPPKMAIWPEYSAELKNAYDEIFINGADPQTQLRKVRERMQPLLDRSLAQKRLREEAMR